MLDKFLPPFGLDLTSPKSSHGRKHHASRRNLAKSDQLLSRNMRGSSKNLLLSSEYGLSRNSNTQSIQLKNQLHPSKSLSKKLFQRAKVIKDPIKQTFLLTSPKYIQKKTSPTSTQQSKELLQIPKLEKKPYFSAKKSQSSNKINFKRNPESITASSNSQRRVSGKSDSLKGIKNQYYELNLETKESKLEEQNSLFSSQSGQSLLCNLKRNLINISSIQKKINGNNMNSPKKQIQQRKSQNNIGFHIQKTASYQLIDQQLVPADSSKELQKINLLQSRNIVKTMTNISQLIMEDDYGIYHSQKMQKHQIGHQSSSRLYINKPRK